MTKIKVLDAEVVKRIAAGETLQRPMNAVKELIENSLDAGANRISVHVQVPASSSSTETSAGLFSIQVTDNGSGIAKDDLTLLCERHATSKLVNVGDLRTVGTFGFRGEALASCSQVARVEVLTRSREEGGEVAWKADYVAGRMTGEPTAIAGNFGTIINVKDLFYGNRVRREALLNSSEEFQKIVQVIQAYALNQAGRCAFALSKRRDRMEVQTSLTDGVVAVVKSLWGEELGGALMPFRVEADAKLGIEEGSGGWATRTTFHKLKSPLVIIFLNGRLIEHAVMRRAMLQAFAPHLPTSPPAHPFVYLNLRVKGSRVDVNVHPSKKQVYFVDESEIVERVVGGIEEDVLRKQYETQNLKPIIIENGKTAVAKKEKSMRCEDERKSTGMAKISALYPSQRVLTDNRNHRMDTFLYHSQTQAKSPGESGSGWAPLAKRIKNDETRFVKNDEMSYVKNDEMSYVKNDETRFVKDEVVAHEIKPHETLSLSSPLVTSQEILLDSQTTTDSERVGIEGSVEKCAGSPLVESNMNTVDNSTVNATQETTVNHTRNLFPSNLMAKSNDQLCRLLRMSVVVGLIDSKWCLLQSGTNLLLCDMDRLNYELFYSLLGQKCFLTDRRFEVDDLRVGGVFEDETIGREAEEVLRGMVGVLEREYGMKFEDSGDSLKLTGLPMIIAGQRCPSRRHLCTFIERLCLLSDSTSILEEIATLYGLVDAEEWDDWEEYVKHVVLPAYRDHRAKYTLRDDFRDSHNGRDEVCLGPPVQIITNTETLYKSFERC